MNMAVVGAAVVVLAASLRVKSDVPVRLTFEAEDMTGVVAPMRVANDQTASGFKALEIPVGVGRGWCNEAGGEARISVDLPQSDAYYVWVRTHWQGGCENAVYLHVDCGRRIVVGNDAIFGVWHWVQSGPYELSAGKHDFRLSNHSHGIKIDKAEIVNDATYAPSGFGHEVTSFFDGFGGCDGQNSGSWTVMSGKWTVIGNSANNARATSATFAHVSSGKGLAIAHQVKWKECDIEVYVMSAGQGKAGVVFSYVDNRNYYLVSWSSARSNPVNAVRVFRVRNGVLEELARGGRGSGSDCWQVLGVRCGDKVASVLVDGETVLTVGELVMNEGNVGLYAEGNEFTYFDNAKVVTRSGDEIGVSTNSTDDAESGGRDELMRRLEGGER